MAIVCEAFELIAHACGCAMRFQISFDRQFEGLGLAPREGRRRGVFSTRWSKKLNVIAVVHQVVRNISSVGCRKLEAQLNCELTTAHAAFEDTASSSETSGGGGGAAWSMMAAAPVKF